MELSMIETMKTAKNSYEEAIDLGMIDYIVKLNKDDADIDKIEKRLRDLFLNSKRNFRLISTSILAKNPVLYNTKVKPLLIEFHKTKKGLSDLVQSLKTFLTIDDFERKEFGEVFTPYPLINDILDKLPNDVWSNPNLKWFDNSAGSGNIPAVIVERLMVGLEAFEPNIDKRYKYIMENMIYFTEKQQKNMFLILSAFDITDELALNVYHGSFLDTSFDEHAKNVWNVDKFDIVVMNPPYNQMLDMGFIKKSYEISDIVLCVHPSTWLIDEKGIQKKFTSTKDLIKNDLINIELFNGNGVFGISLFVPCVISYINKNIQHSGIKCIDRINKIELTYDSINDINKFSNNDIYPILKNKLKSLCENNNVNKVIKTQEDKNYFVNLSQIRGHVKDTNKLGLGMDSDMLVDDFYTMVTKDLEVSLVKRVQREKTQVSFDTKIEGENFLSYVKTNFARFCLSINKNNGNLYCGEYSLIPFLDFTQEWTDEKLFKHFNLSNEEISFINNVIPQYY